MIDEDAANKVLDMLDGADREKRLGILIEIVHVARRSVKTPALTGEQVDRLRMMSYLAGAYPDKDDDYVIHEKMLPHAGDVRSAHAGRSAVPEGARAERGPSPRAPRTRSRGGRGRVTRLTVSVQEASRLADRHPATIRRWVKDGTLDGAMHHNGGWVSLSSLEKLMGTRIKLPKEKAKR